MADQPNGAAPQQAPQVKMNVLTQYIRDMSFENILARKPAAGQVQPDVKVQVALDAKKREAEHQFDVMMKLTIASNAKETGDPMFLMELEYVGVFHVEGVPDEQLHPFLLIECPRMLFPFARRIVSDVTRDGGFPPLNLDTIDFVSLYRAELQRRAAAMQQQAPETTN
ncbi:protein-export chaperone SecB [Pseudooceanicola sp. CBS1P-1]|uniref:Protein-export protein SecB n=1 Tax=Pseudooceanicola albus TaxID=2692189 RepID=A0A6L7FY54_9RHOB|nr:MULTISPECIES: protein-export chaperone SecB [Pseudooceanicola]MBT9385717.1 protein-export chaperone SecB [Pseudooceanicola endophyticus]MXN16751.1 protein-export chaperone SecB [Pseudooceanicola albus]